MYWINFIALIVGGFLASSNLIVGKKPEAAEIVKKLAPYQTWIGLGLLIWGVYNIIVSTAGLIRIIGTYPVLGISGLGVTFLSAIIGLILSMNYLKTKKGIPEDKLAAIESKLKPLQGIFGIAGIIAAVVFIIAVHVHI